MAISTDTKNDFLIGMVIALILLMTIAGVINIVSANGTLGLIQLGPIWSLVFVSFAASGLFISDTDYPATIRRSAMLRTQLRMVCLWEGFLALILLSPSTFIAWPPILVEGLGALLALISMAHLTWSYWRSRDLQPDS
jgi:hypothetical protein